MPTCIAFKRSGMPCTSNGREQYGGMCGTHWHHNNPVLVARFNHDQEIYREAWEGIALGTHQIDVERQRVVRIQVAQAPVAAAPVVICNALKTNGVQCSKHASHPDGKCGMHHGIAARRLEDAPGRVVRREMRRLNRAGATIAQLDAYVAEHTAALVPRVRRDIMWELDHLIMSPFYIRVEGEIQGNRATQEQMDAILIGWMEAGHLNGRRMEIVRVRVENAFMRRQWMDAARLAPPERQFTAAQREAQLAADSQNVHTTEISKQMKDSLDILLAVDVPATQQATITEIVESWRALGYPEVTIERVRLDIVTWWNRTEVYRAGDKLYKKALRGLWWTIKSYKGELRTELEKRLWDECRDAALPYSVCTQGHLARISNVMVGFDDAFVPPVPVGEVLQQKMAAISEMDVPYEKQIELAEAVLAELKVPAEEHKNWLAAF